MLSLKGSLLYVSPSSSRLLEYEPSELVGIPLSSFCHPSDIVSVLRELKEAGSISQPTISLLYRIRRKDSGYMWLEASGKLHCQFSPSRISTEANNSLRSRAWERSQVCHPRRTTKRSLQHVVERSRSSWGIGKFGILVASVLVEAELRRYAPLHHERRQADSRLHAVGIG